MRTLWSRLLALFRGERLDRDLDDEVGFHLAMLEDEFRARGMDAASANLAARREFGGVAQTQEAYRERRGVPWLEIALKDARYALRGLRRNPGFTAAAVLSLALGIGANTAIFSLVHTVMLRMLPVDRPEQLVYLYRTGGWGKGIVSYPLYLELAKRRDLFEGVMARTPVWEQRFSLQNGGGVEFAQTEYVTGNYFQLLGVGPALGRVFTGEDNRTPQAHPLAVLSYEFWQKRFVGDRQVLGRTILVDQQLLRVVGVAAPGFRGVEVEHHPDVWIPVMMSPGKIMDPGRHWIYIVARRRMGMAHARLQAGIDTAMRQYLTARYGDHGDAGFRKFALEQRLEVREAGTGISALRAGFGDALLVLMGAVGLVLLAACANLANLLLARGAARQREIALRFSLGATRGRLILQALTESLLLSAFGALIGILFAVWGKHAVLSFLPARSSEPFQLAPEPVVLAFTAGIAVVAAVLFGLAPALRSTGVDPVSGLRGGRQPVGRTALRRALVVAQVALSVILVALAGLFGRSLGALRSVDPGFRNQNVLAFDLDFPRSWKTSEAQKIRERFVERVALLPGVSTVSYGFPGPFEMGFGDASIRVPGSAATAREAVLVASGTIAPRYFETIGTPLVAGREFDRNDTASSRRVAVVNEAFVYKFFPGVADPLERALSFDDSKPEGGELTYIVGVAHNVRHEGLRKESKPAVYVPATQTEFLVWGSPTMLVRAQMPVSALVPALRRELSKLGPQVALTEPQTIRQHIDDSIFQERILATLSAFFGLLALLLAAIGLYGVVAYATAQRSGEIGVRIALGASRTNVLWMVLRDALILVAVGLAVGLPSSIAAARAVQSMLTGIEPVGAWNYVATGSVLLAAGVAAALLPARRAAAIDPMQALRHE